MNGSEVARMNAKSFWLPYGSVASVSPPDRYSFRPERRRRSSSVIVSVHAIRRCRIAVAAELRDDHVDRREARVARRGGDRGGAVVGLRGSRRAPARGSPARAPAPRSKTITPVLASDGESEARDAERAGDLGQADAGRAGLPDGPRAARSRRRAGSRSRSGAGRRPSTAADEDEQQRVGRAHDRRRARAGPRRSESPSRPSDLDGIRAKPSGDCLGASVEHWLSGGRRRASRARARARRLLGLVLVARPDVVARAADRGPSG